MYVGTSHPAAGFQKKWNSLLKKMSHAPGAYSEAGPVSGPSQESIPDGGSGFFFEKKEVRRAAGPPGFKP